MDMRDMMHEMMENMPDEMRNMLKGVVYSHVDAMVSDPKKREQTRARVQNDPDALKGFECACNMYDLNMQIVQTLGLIKQMLSGFDETNLSSARSDSNLHLFKHITMLVGLTTDNIHDRLREFTGEENENRNGDSSGPGSGSDT